MDEMVISEIDDILNQLVTFQPTESQYNSLNNELFPNEQITPDINDKQQTDNNAIGCMYSTRGNSSSSSASSSKESADNSSNSSDGHGSNDQNNAQQPSNGNNGGGGR
eukprot:UN05229